GHGRTLRPVAASVPSAAANRVVYRRGSLTGWDGNRPFWLEQGFTLAEPPAQHRCPVTLARRVDTPPALDVSAEGARFGASLRYRGLVAYDARGRRLPAHMELRGGPLRLVVDDTRARYPVTVDPFVQQAVLEASHGGAGDNFGLAVAVDG